MTEITQMNTRLMNVLPYKSADSNRNLTARAGLVVLADLFQCLGLNQLVDAGFGQDQQAPAVCGSAPLQAGYAGH